MFWAIILLACFSHSSIKVSSTPSLRLEVGNIKAILMKVAEWILENIFQRFIRVKQHWHPPWEVPGPSVAEGCTERPGPGPGPGGRIFLCDRDPSHCSQVLQQTAEQRRDLALTFARQKARERFMERNGKWNAKCLDVGTKYMA